MIESLPFARKIEAHAISAAGRTEHLEATKTELALIARIYGLLEARSLSADLTLERSPAGEITVAGRVTADIVQECVVSLVPVEQHIDEPIEARLVPDRSPKAPVTPKPGSEMMIDRDAPDPPDVYSGTSIDVGALVLEHFALAIDPYPRAPGVELPASTNEAAGPESPFAALSALKDGQP